jgi:5-methyltetrahydrofolate--homocysteine methyltransferase
MTSSTPLHVAIVNGDAPAARRAVEAALAAGRDPLDVVQAEMMPAMAEVGRLFEQNEYYVPELLLSARAMKAGFEPLRPLLGARGAATQGQVVIGTIAGDLHDIGKNLVAVVLEGAGFEVIDLGTDVAPATFVEAVRTSGARLVCLSALLTVTMHAMRATIEALQAAGLRDRVKVLVGGAPVTAQYARDIGADAYGETAPAAATLARRFVADDRERPRSGPAAAGE